MNFFPAMAIRATDANEARYVRRAMRSLASESVAVVLVSLVLFGMGVFAIGYAFVESDKAIGSIVIGVICVMSGAAMIYSSSVKWWRARGSGPPLVYRIEGRLVNVPWRDAEGNLHHHWELGNQRLVIPAHWDELLEKENPYEIIAAEVVPGPADELIPLAIGDRFSIARDIQHGLLSLPSKTRMILWAFVTILFVVGLCIPHMEDDTPELVRNATRVLGGLWALIGPWAIVDVIRIRRIHRRLLRYVPADRSSEKTPLPRSRA